jgi:hypothetical protein
MEFRIQIEEKRNGTMRYIPQVGTPRLRIGKFDFLPIEWENIIKSGWGYMSAQLMYESHSTEQEALDIIDGYKKYIFEEEQKVTIKTTYKPVK